MRGLRSRRSATVASILGLAVLVSALGVTQLVQADSGKAVAAKKCKRKHRKKCRKAAPPPTSTTTPPATTTTTTPAPTSPATPQYPLAVAAGPGGTISSSPAGISCPPDCTENYNAGQVVNLGDQPDFGFLFNAWSGDCSVDPCSVSMNGPRSVSASFVAGHTLSVTLEQAQFPPDDDGSVTSSPGSISCTKTGGQPSGNCADTFPTSTSSVTLTATPQLSIALGGRINWGGACTGTSSSSAQCVVSMTTNQTVTISFTET
jgi:Divergent InlB B-repeat domain